MKARSLWVDNQSISIFGKEIGAFYYEERALLIAKPKDIVILDYKIDNEYLYQLGKIPEYRSIFLICLNTRYFDLVESILKWEKVDLFIQYLKKHNYVLRSYIPDGRIRLLSKCLKLKCYGYDFYETYKEQLNLIALLKKVDCNYIETLPLGTTNKESALDFIKENKSSLIKPNISIGGKNIVEVNNRADIEKFYASNNKLNEYILQRKIRKDFEGSIQFLFENEVFHIYICETFNPCNSYSGFCYPCTLNLLNKLQKDATKILTVLVDKYKKNMDCFGIDFIISDGRIFYHDLNARKTAVTYVLSFLKKIYHDFDMHKNFKIICLYFKIKKKILYSTLLEIIKNSHIPDLIETGEGLMIINPSTINLGFIQVISVSFINRENIYLNNFKKELKRRGVEIL